MLEEIITVTSIRIQNPQAAPSQNPPTVTGKQALKVTNAIPYGTSSVKIKTNLATVYTSNVRELLMIPISCIYLKLILISTSLPTFLGGCIIIPFILSKGLQ